MATPRTKYILFGTLILTALLAVFATLLVQRRMTNCQAVPVFAAELLPNANLVPDAADASMPAGWERFHYGVELQGGGTRGFELDGDGRSLQLLGINNYVETPGVPVAPDVPYCFVVSALTDSTKGATRLQLLFRWLDGAGAEVAQTRSAWDPVVQWTPELRDWSTVRFAATAPANATHVRVRILPAADDRVYLDAPHVRRTTTEAARSAVNAPANAAPATNLPSQTASPPNPSLATVLPWPNGASAAVSFSFDWETAMGGLIHTRSDDPRFGFGDDAEDRGLRMREGVTTTLTLFAQYDIRATYYANGYNFLAGNTERRQFLGNPTFTWATSPPWPDNRWTTRPWFADDPFGTVATHPAWYFADLVPLLQNGRQDIQSHTFSHFDGGRAPNDLWRADLDTWIKVAAEVDVPPARSIAFPWSSSAGLGDADWNAISAAGIRSVTRTNPNQPRYRITDRTNWQCLPIPAHPEILACPDSYLTPDRVETVLSDLDTAVARGGVIDIWAHTEEVTQGEQIAVWTRVVAEAARRRDAGQAWIAPLAEITDRQRAAAAVSVRQDGQRLVITNPTQIALPALAVRLADGRIVVQDVAAGATVVVE